MKNNLLLIDGSSLLSIQYYATIPDELKKEGDNPKYYPLISKNRYGVYNNAIAGFFRVLGEMMKIVNPSGIAVTFDLATETYRKQACPDYKANRAPRPYPLSIQSDILQTALRNIGISVYTSDVFEGDDIIATIVDKMKRSYDNICVVTGDKDYFQLVCSTVFLAMYIAGDKKQQHLEADGAKRLYGNYFFYDFKRVYRDLGVFPWQIADYKALVGDTSDNIHGLSGIGPKSADSILKIYKSIEDLYTALENIPEADMIQKFKDNGCGNRAKTVYSSLTDPDAKTTARKAKKLATMYKNVPVGTLSTEALQVRINKEKYNEFLKDMNVHVNFKAS